MRDLALVAVVVAFFAVAVVYVRWCDRIVGPDDAPGASDVEAAPTEPAVRR